MKKFNKNSILKDKIKKNIEPIKQIHTYIIKKKSWMIKLNKKTHFIKE
jgi:hypothetical protein